MVHLCSRCIKQELLKIQCEIFVSFKSYNSYCFPRPVYFYNSFWCFLICINIIKKNAEQNFFVIYYII